MAERQITDQEVCVRIPVQIQIFLLKFIIIYIYIYIYIYIRIVASETFHVLLENRAWKILSRPPGILF